MTLELQAGMFEREGIVKMEYCEVLGLAQSLSEPLLSLTEWYSPEAESVLWLIQKVNDVPAELLDAALALFEDVPDKYLSRSQQCLAGLGHVTEDRLQWGAVGLLVDDARATRFRRILQGLDPDPLISAYESIGQRPSAEGLVPSRSLTGLTDTRRGLSLGAYDVEPCRSMGRISHSTHWVSPMVLNKRSAHVRLDPLRLAPLGQLGRGLYLMNVYGAPFRWERVLKLECIESVKWFAEDLEGNPNPELITELVWKPRDDEIVLEIEELPPSYDVAISGARYLHGIVNRSKQCFTHLDGAIRWLDATELDRRTQEGLDAAGRIGQRQKLFRLDENLSYTDVLDIVSAFFVWNDDIDVYFNPKSPRAAFTKRKPVYINAPN